MDTLTAYCGLSCGTCPIHLATLEPDLSVKQELRISIAGLCTEQYGMNLLAEDITDCDGCKTNTGRLFSGCKACRIRPCAMNKKVDNCSSCADYACEKLEAFFTQDPEAKQRLEAIRKSAIT
jgi:hypothetical protein